MGISDVIIDKLFEFYYEDERTRCFCGCYEVVYDGPIKLQKEEVDSCHLMAMHEIIRKFEEGELFTADSIFACKKYIELKGFPEPIGPRPELLLI